MPEKNPRIGELWTSNASGFDATIVHAENYVIQYMYDDGSGQVVTLSEFLNYFDFKEAYSPHRCKLGECFFIQLQKDFNKLKEEF